ncbi:probable apyrase 7 [Impatiens glandulifera]|uniref:probable apyrase 7 n=1 Tax=Impatiens glandulifera TaxID=253017 RepID=UPI001FB19A5D|nr:probable apyrase 7 [Impatiens glandulifera]
MEPKSPSKSKSPELGFNYNNRIWRISTILFICMFLLVAGICVVLKPRKTPLVRNRSYFTIVIDCGSTGSRVNVYKWIVKSNPSDGGLPVLLHSYPDNSTSDRMKGRCWYHCLQTEPGLDKWIGNSSGVRASLEPLILWAKQLIPPHMHEETPIFVLATAGLRRLPRKDSRSVMANVEALLKEHRFIYHKKWIRVLTGKEEAYYGWIALNFKMGTFHYSSRSQRTLGLLDLGGSSLQVVTEIDRPKRDKYYLRSSIGPFEHHLLAFSLPAFGLNEAFDRTVFMLSHSESLREGTTSTFEIGHPCLSPGFVQNYTCKGCFSESYADQDVLLRSDSNWKQCRILARAAAVNSSSSYWSSIKEGPNGKVICASKKGSMMQKFNKLTHPVARFHALSGFYAVYKLLNLSSRANLSKIWEKHQHLCSKPSLNLNSISSNPRFAAQFCFKVSYMASLIEDGLCLGKEEIIFGPGDISWTLGAALVEGQFLWNGSTTAWTHVLALKKFVVIWSPLLLFILLAFLLYLVYRSQIKLPMLSRKITSVGVMPSYMYPKRRPN